ncbi:hypothetical protein MMC25_004294 [Agyrium rufum]|nr:hypothetical protein [Agyrium rufum]
MSFEQLFPVVSSTPVSSIPPSLPFKFLGGFGWPTKMIGALLSMQGFYSLPTQFFFAPYLTNRMGSLLTWRICVVSFPLLYFLFPYTTLLPGSVKLPIVCFFLIWKVTVGILAYPANAILLTNAAPSTLVLGTINGLAASTASLARAFGPTISGWVHSIGLDMGYAGFAFWTLAVVASIGAVQSFWMEEVEGSDDLPEILNEEAALNEPYVEPHTVQVALNDIRNELLGEAEDDRSHQS